MNAPPPVRPMPIGVSAKTVASAVMTMGRSRLRAPSRTASSSAIPRARYWLMRSMSTIALDTTMPTSNSVPIRAGTPSGVSVATSATSAPTAANGTDTSRMNGCARLRNVATMTTNTRAIAATSAIPRSLKASAWSAAAPPTSTVAPAGRSTAPISAFTASVAAPRSVPAGVTETVADRSPSMRLIDVGELASSTVATSISRTGPVAVDTGISPIWVIVSGTGPAQSATPTGPSAVWSSPTSCAPVIAAAAIPETCVSVSPYCAAALRSTVTSTISWAAARSLVTSADAARPLIASWSWSVASASVSSSRARTTRSIDEVPTESPADTATSVAGGSVRPATASRMSAAACSPSASSSSVIANDALSPALAPPKAAIDMSPPLPTVACTLSTASTSASAASTCWAASSWPSSEVPGA